MPSKIPGTPVYTFEGIKIYVRPLKAKGRGMDRVWLHIRQEQPKKWRSATTLSYVNAVDLLFRREK